MNKHKKYGFTIIEVVLVLAIAGLIFLMVFIALPALQRNQRDAQRKRQAQDVGASIARWVANNRGATSSTRAYVATLVDQGYIKEDEMRDPSTGELPTPIESALGGGLYVNYQSLGAGEYGVDPGGYCQNNVPIDISGAGNYASQVLVFGLEGGGWICASTIMK